MTTDGPLGRERHSVPVRAKLVKVKLVKVKLVKANDGLKLVFVNKAVVVVELLGEGPVGGVLVAPLGEGLLQQKFSFASAAVKAA